MSKSFRKDLTGQRFGRLTVLEFVPNEKKGAYWLCRCDCGNTRVIESHKLSSEHTLSCGCLRNEVNKTHGESNSRIYRIWQGMRTRCYNPNHKDYKNYGLRGIYITPEWNNFSLFKRWALSNGYSENLSIDRIDNDGNYEPSNCRWINKKTQCRNLRKNVFVNYNGKSITIAEAAELSGINYDTLKSRYRNGDRGDRLFRPGKTK